MKIETSRLLVRNLRPTDGDALYAVLSDPEVMRYVEPPFTAEQTRTFLQAAGLCEPPLVYAVVWKQTGELIGHLIWHPWDETGMELGWILRRDFWGRGIAAELTAALLAQTDRDVILECSPDQRVTQYIAETFGFSRIGQQKGVLQYQWRPAQWIFFDLGSTLIDETEADLHRIRDMTAGTGVTVEAYQEKRRELFGRGEAGDSGAITFFGLKKTPWHSEDERPYPDAAPTLAALKARGFRLGVIANQNPGTGERLAAWGLLQYFNVIAASSDLGAAKPDPEIFRRALERACCTPARAFMVGDRPDNDVAPANCLGMHTVRILRGPAAFRKPVGPEEQAEHTIRELGELFSPEILGGSPFRRNELERSAGHGNPLSQRAGV